MQTRKRLRPIRFIISIDALERKMIEDLCDYFHFSSASESMRHVLHEMHAKYMQSRDCMQSTRKMTPISREISKGGTK